MGYFTTNKRISYILDNVQIEIDFWPKIPPYLEIEVKSISEVEKIIKKLGFEKSRTTTVNTAKVYKKYGIDIDSIKELKFEKK